MGSSSGGCRGADTGAVGTLRGQPGSPGWGWDGVSPSQQTLAGRAAPSPRSWQLRQRSEMKAGASGGLERSQAPAAAPPLPPSRYQRARPGMQHSFKVTWRPNVSITFSQEKENRNEGRGEMLVVLH